MPTAPPAHLGRPDAGAVDLAATPYRFALPFGLTSDLVVEDLLGDDEQLWVPQSAAVSFRPLLFGGRRGST